MKQLKEFIILSAELSILDNTENITRTRRLGRMLDDLKLSYKVINGVYKGSSEVSFMVIVKDEAEIEAVTDLGLKTFRQESILFRDYKGNAELVYASGKTEKLGKFTKVENDAVLDSYNVVDGEKWVCV